MHALVTERKAAALGAQQASLAHGRQLEEARGEVRAARAQAAVVAEEQVTQLAVHEAGEAKLKQLMGAGEAQLQAQGAELRQQQALLSRELEQERAVHAEHLAGREEAHAAAVEQARQQWTVEKQRAAEELGEQQQLVGQFQAVIAQQLRSGIHARTHSVCKYQSCMF